MLNRNPSMPNSCKEQPYTEQSPTKSGPLGYVLFSAALGTEFDVDGRKGAALETMPCLNARKLRRRQTRGTEAGAQFKVMPRLDRANYVFTSCHADQSILVDH
jgi:hypothetical protein